MLIFWMDWFDNICLDPEETHNTGGLTQLQPAGSGSPLVSSTDPLMTCQISAIQWTPVDPKKYSFHFSVRMCLCALCPHPTGHFSSLLQPNEVFWRGHLLDTFPSTFMALPPYAPQCIRLKWCEFAFIRAVDSAHLVILWNTPDGRGKRTRLLSVSSSDTQRGRGPEGDCKLRAQ